MRVVAMILALAAGTAAQLADCTSMTQNSCEGTDADYCIWRADCGQRRNLRFGPADVESQGCCEFDCDFFRRLTAEEETSISAELQTHRKLCGR